MNTIKSILSKTRKRIKKFVEEKIEACKEILSSAQNHLTLGLYEGSGIRRASMSKTYKRLIYGCTLVGLGVGLILSSYLKAS